MYATYFKQAITLDREERQPILTKMRKKKDKKLASFQTH